MALEHYAAIDIGTNAARLFVGYVQSKKKEIYVKKVSLTRIPLRLGEDVFSTGEISEKRYIRFEKTMLAFKHLMNAYEVVAYRACATSAMREAKNAEKIKTELLKKTGINLEIISGEEEAAIIYGNFFSGNFDGSKTYLFIDVGGGSTEISVLRNGEKVDARSFDLGTLRMLKNKVKNTIWDQMHEWLNHLKDIYGEMDAIGSGGNINKLFKLMDKRNSDVVHVYELESMERFLASMSFDERIEKLRLKPDRADVIAPAARIYLTAMKFAGIDRMHVPKTGLADAIVYKLFTDSNGLNL